MDTKLSTCSSLTQVRFASSNPTSGSASLDPLNIEKLGT